MRLTGEGTQMESKRNHVWDREGKKAYIVPETKKKKKEIGCCMCGIHLKCNLKSRQRSA